MSQADTEGLIVYRENKPFVRRALGGGRIEYLDLTEWSFADRFFAFLSASDFLAFTQTSFPTPRVKEEAPVWFLTACALQLKLHGESAFLKLKHLLRSGAILSRLRFNVSMRPGGGFNGKNKKPRETMADQDTVRKFYKDTPAVRLFRWFNRDVARWLHHHHAFAQEGHFLCDLTHLSVPDNRSTAFNLITPGRASPPPATARAVAVPGWLDRMHVYFILLVYTLVQLYLNHAQLNDLTQRTIASLRHEDKLGVNAVIVYAGHFFATFDLDEYSHILLHLRPGPQERMRQWIERFRASKTPAPP